MTASSKCVSFQKTACPDFWGSFSKTPTIFQKGYYQNVRKFAVEGREITPRPMETL